MFTNSWSLRRKEEKGSILFLTLMFLILINLFAVAFWQLVPVELHSARRQMLDTEAYFASDAGVVDSLAFLEKITSDGNIDNYVNTNGELDADGNKVLKRSGTLNEWEWNTEIIPGPETYGNAANPAPNPLRVYKIVATAKRKGSLGQKEQYRKVSAWVKQRSFTENNWGNMATAGQDLWLFMDSFKLGGDYHSNGKGLLQIESANFWNNSTAAIKGDFSFSKTVENPDNSLGYVDGVQYSSWGANNVPYHITGSQKGQPRNDRYSKISGNGRAGVKVKSPIQMPLNTDSIAFGVWGTSAPTAPITDAQKIFGATSTVNIAINGSVPGGPVSNGIWIDGNVSQIDFLTEDYPTAQSFRDDATPNDPSTDNQIIRIYQGGSANSYVEVREITGRNWTIPTSPGTTVLGSTHSTGTVLRPSDNGGTGWTVVRDRATNRYAVYSGRTNGAIFASGNVNGVRGVVKGRRSIGVSTDTGAQTTKDKTIFINGDIFYAGTEPGERPASSDTMLGLIGYAVRMASEDGAPPTLGNPQLGLMHPTRTSSSTSDPNYLYCSIFAGRRNDPAAGWSGNNPTRYGGGFGSWKPDDSGLRQGHLSLFGSITEGIRQWKGTGNTGGNSYEFDIDPNLEEIQPPFFPTLPSYDILSWEEKSVFNY